MKTLHLKTTNLLGFVGYIFIIFACGYDLASQSELSLGRHPWRNFKRTVAEMAQPSFLNIWWGEENFEYRSNDGELLRTENQQELEKEFLHAVLRALWVTFVIATLGTFLASVFAIPLGFIMARNMGFPRIISWSAKLILDGCRSIHTLVFGLFFVGIIGLGPTAGILAIAAHSLGTFGKLYAESIETLDMRPIEAVSAVGAGPLQTLVYAVWPAVFPQIVSTNLYLWEYNTRDSTILGFIGAGGLGLLISEAMSLFQWERLATLIIVVVAFVATFDYFSRQMRQRLL